jgi:ectoine hydroxylase-related dioxygenase (phytanoyl-CoA dioxygenase family)
MTEVVSDHATLPRVSADTSYDEIGDLIAEHGGVIVIGLFGPEIVAAVNAELDAAADLAEPSQGLYQPLLDDFHGAGTTHVTALPAKSRTFAVEVMAHPLYRAMAERFLTWSLLEEVGMSAEGSWHLNLAHLIIRGPGSVDQMLHRDEDIWMEVPYPRRGVLLLASMIAWVDFTRENGATRLVPGSHRWPDVERPVTGRSRQAQDDELVYAEMPAGSAVIYLGTTIHGGSANLTESTMRRGAHLSYCLGWLRTEENNYLAVPPDIARELPRECQEILGYGSTGLLGAVGLRNPVDLLAEGKL